MGYFNRSEVEVGAWTQVRGDGEISYHVCVDEVEVSFGSPPAFQLVLDARALRRCVDTFGPRWTTYARPRSTTTTRRPTGSGRSRQSEWDGVVGGRQVCRLNRA